jgi:hypothetical protein
MGKLKRGEYFFCEIAFLALSLHELLSIVIQTSDNTRAMHGDIKKKNYSLTIIKSLKKNYSIIFYLVT